MEDVNPWIAFYKELASLGFPALLFLILALSYLDIWMWTKTHRKIVELHDVRVRDCEARCVKLEAKLDTSQDLILRATGILESTVTKISRRG